MGDESIQCTSWICDFISLLMTVLQIGQIVPQHYEMYTEQSVKGVSVWLIFIGGLYTHLATLDIVISSNDLFYCNEKTMWRCFLDSQPLIQMIGSSLFSGTLWYWYLKFSKPKAEYNEILTPEERSKALTDINLYSSARSLFNVFIYFTIISSLADVSFILLYGPNDEKSLSFASFCGLSSAALNGIMWLPQIYETWSYKHRGALAVEWVFASIVMDVVYSVYLAQLGVNFSVWANNIPDGVQTFILLILVLHFDNEDAKNNMDNFGLYTLGDNVESGIERRSSTLQKALSYESSNSKEDAVNSQ